METSRDGVHLKQEKETCRQYSTEYGSIDTILDPPMFSINSIFKPYMQKKAIWEVEIHMMSLYANICVPKKLN